MKISVDVDERYPDYFFSDEEREPWNTIEITDSEFEWCKKAIEEYEKVQDFMEKKHEESQILH